MTEIMPVPRNLILLSYQQGALGMKFDVVQLESTGIDVIDGDRGKNYPHQNELLSTGFCLFLSAKNVTKSGFSFSETQFISQRKDALLNNGRLCRGDIVITTRGTVGNVALYSPQVPYENIRINSGMLIIRCANNISNQYLYQVLRSEWFQKQIMAVQSGSAQPQLPKSHFLKMNIPLPPLPIQEKIASILQLIDDKITTNNSINDNLEQQAQAIFRQELLQNGELPPNWTTGSLLDIADYLNGLAMQKFRPVDGERGLPVLKIKELRQGFCDYSSELCSPNIKPEFIVHDGDVIFSWSGSLLVDLWCGGTCGLNQHLFKVTSVKYPKWFYYTWTAHHLARFVAIAADKATTMGHIKREDLAKAEVIIPDVASMERIGGVLQPIYDLVINQRIENRKLSMLRDSLLPKLMSGELDVSAVEL